MLSDLWKGLQTKAGVVQRDLHGQGELRVQLPDGRQLPGHAASQRPALLPEGVPRLSLLESGQLGQRK